CAVVFERCIEVAVPVPAAEAEELIEALSERMMGILLAVVPLAETAGGVTAGLKDLGQRDFFGAHDLISLRHARDAGPDGVAPAQQRRPRRRTDRRDIEAVKPHARIMQRIQNRRINLLVPMPAESPPTLSVGDDQYDNGGCSKR